MATAERPIVNGGWDMSRESFLREAAAFAEGVPAEPEPPKKFCVSAGFKVVCDLPRCIKKCQFETPEMAPTKGIRS